MPTDTATYQLKGIVVASDAATGVVSVESEAIPGLMGAMTMPYKLAQPGVASELHPGDHITARLRISESASVIDQIDVTAQAKPDYKPAKVYNVPTTGRRFLISSSSIKAARPLRSTSFVAKHCWSPSSTRAAHCRITAYG